MVYCTDGGSLYGKRRAERKAEDLLYYLICKSAGSRLTFMVQLGRASPWVTITDRRKHHFNPLSSWYVLAEPSMDSGVAWIHGLIHDLPIGSY
jgi:hypothetical protein